ncbi:MAG TPA: alpha/beta hydrolase [Xanthobacteraceae bacterium]|nr:alpha/beta hydrolase [Xanthobacteraceae bacterium]
MPLANVRSVAINYRVIGETGPWLALMPGGRRGHEEFLPLAGKIAKGGFRVLLHDRRNTGASDVAFDASEAEDAHWAEDLHALLGQLGALPAFVGGSSSGCRTSLLFYQRHPRDVRGLLLFRVTGGAFAAERLPENYYSQFIRAAEKGGMEAVAAMEHWRERIAARPENRERLLDMPKERFLDVMTKWREMFLAGAHHPVIGVSREDLQAIDVPVIVIPGNDKIHSGPSGRTAAALIPGATLHELPVEDTDRDLVPYEEWAPYEDEIAEAFIAFMRQAMERKTRPAAAAS